MSELRQQMIDAVLVRGFSPRTHKSYLAAISKTIIIEGVSATELVRFWPSPALTGWKVRVRSRGSAAARSSQPDVRGNSFSTDATSPIGGLGPSGLISKRPWCWRRSSAACR